MNDKCCACERISLEHNSEDRRVDVVIDGKPFTSYIYPDTIKKPVLYPLRTARGTVISRGYPLDPRPRERVDHPHHVGLWFNYGNANGLDFWNNSDAIAPEKRDAYGTIRHRALNEATGGCEKGVLAVTMEWLTPDDDAILREDTTFIFTGSEARRTIDRVATLTALAEDVLFEDDKEGMLGIRVARAMEQPSDSPTLLADEKGQPKQEPEVDNEGVNGLYRSSNGLEGDSVWATRADWVSLSAKVEEEDVSLAVIDHPQNPGYPTYWHARGYGLFAANPLGQKAFSDGKEELNLKLCAGESATFRYRIVIGSPADLTDAALNDEFETFGRT